jgi:stage II sporulation protein D
MPRFALLLAMLLLSYVSAQGQIVVRVLLDRVSGSMSIPMYGAHDGYVDGQLRFSTQVGLTWPVQAYNSQIIIDGQSIGRSLTLEPRDGNLLSWNGSSYRGGLRLLADGNDFKIINVVGLEDYLRGVVPSEMQASWTLEALKAQAVAARTYTVVNLKPQEDYDLCATELCQKYSGVAKEHPSSDQAIRETYGQVLTYGRQFARTYYHSDSGGIIASSAEVWGNDLPYLVAHRDIEQQSPHQAWDREIDPSKVAEVLASYGKNVGQVQSMRILGYSDSGRVSTLEVSGSAGSVVLSGTSLTKMMRDWGMKSTRFVMTGNLSARGSGWGHGVGMSQYGAKTLAEQGYVYSQILGFYYPGTELQIMTYALAQGE